MTPLLLSEDDTPSLLTVEIVYGQYLEVLDRLREIDVQWRDLQMKQRLLQSVQAGMQSLAALKSLGIHIGAEEPNA